MTPTKPRRSGPRGAHTNPRKLLSASPEQWERWQKAATAASLTLSAWLRQAADEKARRQR